MASARAQALQERRQRDLYGSGRIRILAPQNNAVASIARSTASNELNVMVSRYNNGEVSNEDMRTFLVKMSQNVGLSNNDKLEVESQIKDFDNRIVKDRLEASYKAAPEGTLQQLQAAQALSQYYQSRASQMQPGTPAQSQNLQDSAMWMQKTTDIKTQMAKRASQVLRYQEEQKINQLPNNSPERLYEKAMMYKQLAEKAAADGDEVGYNKYVSYYEQHLTTAEETAQREMVTNEKNEIRQILGSYVDAYHDGKINENQYLQLLAEISPRIDATNDYGLINSLNRTTDTIQKNLEKGGLRRTTTASGLPAVLGKGKNGLSGNVSADQQAEFNYSDSLRKLKQALEKGKITSEKYAEGVAQALITHAGELQEQMEEFQAVADVNPNAKVLFNGRKTRVADVLDALDKDYEDIQGQAQAVSQGNFALVEVAPTDFTKTGAVGSGKSFAILKPVDASNLPEGKYAKDVEGIYHEILKKTRPLTPEEIATFKNGQYTPLDEKGNPLKDDKGKIVYKKAKETAPGIFETETGETESRAYKPGSSEWLPVTDNSEGIMPGFTQAKNMYDQDKATEAYLKKRPERADKLYTASPFTQPKPSVNVDKALDTGGLAMTPATSEKPKVVTPTPRLADTLNVPQTLQINDIQRPLSIPQTGTAIQTVKTPALKLATQPPSPVAKLAQQNKIPTQKVQAPPKINNLPSYKDVGKQDYSIGGSLKALGKNILGFFGVK